MHTLSPPILPLLETPLEVFFWNGVQLRRRVPHYLFSTLKSGSYPYTHDSSPVITVFRNPGSVLAVSRRSCATSKRSYLCSGDNNLGTNFAATRFMFKSSRKIACAESLLTPISSAISRTVKRRSAITKFCTLSAALRKVWGCHNAVHSPLMCGHL